MANAIAFNKVINLQQASTENCKKFQIIYNSTTLPDLETSDFCCGRYKT